MNKKKKYYMYLYNYYSVDVGQPNLGIRVTSQHPKKSIKLIPTEGNGYSFLIKHWKITKKQYMVWKYKYND